jgi:DNA-binding SARP family transcriptional activator
MCKLYLFGTPALECNGHSQPIPRRKVMALLAYLAVTQQSHSREALVALLWPDDDPRSGRSDLSRMLFTLRKTMGAAYLHADRESVALNRDADLWVDVLHFRQQLEACRKTTDLDDDCRQKLASAVDLYQADFLSGFTLPEVLILMSGSCCKPKPYAAIWVGPWRNWCISMKPGTNWPRP